ncbi:MAG: hypothetical protein LBS35_09680 [Synergistaceae bacterium]|jgi:hypothetical protein|nr:hypothetical protein [Synergistaceae bacterium]
MTKKIALSLVICAALCAAAAAAQAAIPKKGSVAIVVGGYDEQHILSVQAIFVRELRANDYKVVDEKKLAEMRRNEAARLALEGDVDAILRLRSKYKVDTVITANIEAGRPMLNPFDLFTGTASIVVWASSGANMIYGDTSFGKKVGYTPNEAAQKSVEAAASIAAEKLTL